MSIPIPRWIDAMPAKKRSAARVRFLVRVAAAYATPEGTVPAMSEQLGLHKNSLNTMIAPGRGDQTISPQLAKSIERLVGRDILPREMLCPEIFGDDEDA